MPPIALYVERNCGIAKRSPMRGNTNATTDMTMMVRKYFRVFSTET